MQTSQITLILPAYNEEADLPALLARIKQSMSWALYRVIVVDDGSCDRTAKIARQFASHMPMELIQHPSNQGLGATIRTGLLAAASQDGVIVTMDADNSHDPSLIRSMVSQLEAGVEVVIASRFRSGAEEHGVPAFRRILSRLSSGMLRLAIGYPGVRDYTSGFRVYRAAVIRRLIDSFGESSFLRESDFACMLELLLKLREFGARVSEVPLVLRYDLKTGASKMRILRTAWRYFVLLWHWPSAWLRILRIRGRVNTIT